MSASYTMPSRRLRSRPVLLVLATVLALAFGGAGGADRASSAAGETPMLGADLIWATCGPGNTPYILWDYGNPGVRADVLLRLHAMRVAGVDSFGIFIWSAHDPLWWQIPSAQGSLTEPYRTNLISLLSDIRRVGFEQVTVTFQPLRSSDMKSWTGTYDPALFEENWSFIRDVRTLVKQHGPASTRIDLLGEGAPNDWDRAHRPEWWNDLIRLYRNYVDAFGHEDVTVSAIAKSVQEWGNPWDDVQRMQNLIDLLRASGRPLPTWFALSLAYDGNALADLRAVDEVLTRNGLSQPLTISETAYNNADVAAAVATFLETSKRPLLELTEWPLYSPEVLRLERVVPPPRCASPPFRIDAYWNALRGAPPSTTLRAWVGSKGQVALQAPTGAQVKALITGTYTIIVRDTSARHGFRLALAGEGFERTTGVRFRGTKTWRVSLDGALGHPYTYSSVGPRGRHGSFTVLVPG